MKAIEQISEHYAEVYMSGKYRGLKEKLAENKKSYTAKEVYEIVKSFVLQSFSDGYCNGAQTIMQKVEKVFGELTNDTK